MNKPRSVVVTGMGVISAIGRDTHEFARALREGRSGIGYLAQSSAYCPLGYIGAGLSDFCFVPGLRQYSGLPAGLLQRAEQCARRSPLMVQSAVLSSLEAWQQARLYEQPIPTRQMGIVVAGSNLTQRYQYDNRQKFQESPEYLSPWYALHFFDTDHVGTLSEIFSIQGEGFTVGGASASGNTAIIKGFQAIRSGLVEACLVAAPMTDLSPMEMQGFSNLGAMGGKNYYHEPGKACRPFDKDHEGFIYGQSSASLVLESRESAKKREVEVLAEIVGGALVLDGNRLADSTVEGETRAMEEALAQAHLQPGHVDYINTHGTSTPLGDETEIRAIKKVLKNDLERVWLNSTKSLVGHCLSSAGVVEAAAVVIQMREGFVHPNLNLDNPIDGDCRFCGPRAVPAKINLALSNSFGFGGINTSVIFKKPVHQYSIH